MKNQYQLTKDKEVLFTGSENECFIKLLKIQPQSTVWAIKHEGYVIKRKSTGNYGITQKAL